MIKGRRISSALRLLLVSYSSRYNPKVIVNS